MEKVKYRDNMSAQLYDGKSHTKTQSFSKFINICCSYIIYIYI